MVPVALLPLLVLAADAVLPNMIEVAWMFVPAPEPVRSSVPIAVVEEVPFSVLSPIVILVAAPPPIF